MKLRNLADLAKFAEAFLSQHPNGAAVGLIGDLGAGKTTFVRACVETICRRAGVPVPRVVSPSFTIQQSYRQLQPPVEHFDLYRMETLGFEGLVDLGYFETLEQTRAAKGFLFVEWPERAGELLQLSETLTFTLEGEDRSVTLTSLLRS